MIKLILVSHGSFAAGIREAAEMILGDQSDLQVLGVFPGDTLELFSAKLEKAIDQFGDPEHTLILADLTGGTPCNAALMMALKHRVRVLAGLNLPMLIEILTTRKETGIDELAEEAVSVGRAGIISAADLTAAL